MTIATRFFRYLHRLDVVPGSDDYGMLGLKWMHDHDPHGNGSLSPDKSTAIFTMSDGSRVLLDMQTSLYMPVD